MAGSATASTAAVMAGGSALAATIGGGGLAAGGKLIADNVSRAVNSGGGQAATQAASKTYYQITSKASAQTIINTSIFRPIEFQKVFVTNFQPALAQAQNIGARSLETVVKFNSNYSSFIQDPTVGMRGVLMNNTPGAISIFNVVEVGFK